jgi:hypothetical protein
MGCPVHIWVPVMVGMAPFARVARDKFRALRFAHSDAPVTSEVEAPALKRWAPVQSASSSATQPDPS